MAEVNQGLGELNGSISSTRDEQIRAARANMLRDALADSREAIVFAMMGTPVTGCSEKVGTTVKKLNGLSLSETESEPEPATAAPAGAIDAK